MATVPVPQNVDLSETRQPQLYASTITTYILALLALGARFLSRRLLKSGYRLDDYFAVAATLAATGFMVSTLVWIRQGYGLHFQLLGPDFITDFFKDLFVGELLYTLTLVFAKYSILAFCWRLFGSTASIRLPIYIITAFTTLWGIAVILVTIFQCTPVSAFWNRTQPGKCTVNTKHFFIGNAIPNILTDVALMCLPLPYIWRLNRPMSQKIALGGVFVLGGFVIIISIVRLVECVNANLLSPDLDYNFALIGVWTETESNIAIVCACLPSCRPILSLILTGSPTPSKRPGYPSSSKRSGDGSSEPIKSSNLDTTGSHSSEGYGGETSISSDTHTHHHRPFTGEPDEEKAQTPWAVNDPQNLPHKSTTIASFGGRPETISEVRYPRVERKISVGQKSGWMTGKRPRGSSITREPRENMKASLDGRGSSINVRNDVDIHWSRKEPANV